MCTKLTIQTNGSVFQTKVIFLSRGRSSAALRPSFVPPLWPGPIEEKVVSFMGLACNWPIAFPCFFPYICTSTLPTGPGLATVAYPPVGDLHNTEVTLLTRSNRLGKPCVSLANVITATDLPEGIRARPKCSVRWKARKASAMLQAYNFLCLCIFCVDLHYFSRSYIYFVALS